MAGRFEVRNKLGRYVDVTVHAEEVWDLLAKYVGNPDVRPRSVTFSQVDADVMRVEAEFPRDEKRFPMGGDGRGGEVFVSWSAGTVWDPRRGGKVKPRHGGGR